MGSVTLSNVHKRFGDVSAVRDTTIAVLSSANFEALLHRQPIELNRVFAQAIFNHLRHTPQSVERKVAQTFAVIPLHPDAGAGDVAAALAKAFSRSGRARHLSCATLREVTGANGGSRAAGEMLNQLEKQVEAHWKPLAFAGGLVVTTLGSVLGVSIYWAATRRERLRRERWSALRRLWEHPERIARKEPPRGSMAWSIARKVLTATLTYVALEASKRMVRNALPTARTVELRRNDVVVRTLPA